MSASASSLRPTRSRSVTPARRPPDRVLARPASAARRCADGSRWRGIRAGTATEAPRSPVPRRARQRAEMRRRETATPRDGRRPKCWCRRRSPAAAFVRAIAHGIPGGVPQVRVVALALEAGPTQLEWRSTFGFGDDQPQAALDQRPQGDSVARREPADLAQQGIGDLHRRLHRPISTGVLIWVPILESASLAEQARDQPSVADPRPNRPGRLGADSHIISLKTERSGARPGMRLAKAMVVIVALLALPAAVARAA